MKALVALLLASFTGPLWAECDAADTTALQWLDRMSHSLREVSYQGVFTYQHGNSIQTLRISHSVSGNSESEEITRLTGSGASVLRAEHPLDCIHPGHALVRLDDAFNPVETGNPDNPGNCGLSKYYQLKMGEERRVAGRAAVTLDVLPRDMYRYGYQMALDAETGLLLRSQTMAQDGKILERFQFADLTIGPVQTQGTRVDVVHHAQHPGAPATTGSATSSRGWSVQWLPEGFLQTAGEAASGTDKTFTDGLAVFSVFVEQVKQQIVPGEGRARQGGTTAYTRGLQLAGQPLLISIVGEVPVNTARMVADSVQWAIRDVE
jgi:sigma-E factor negative regulatory protein RseB